MSAPHWIAPLFAAIDAKDTDAFGGFLAADASFRFGNWEAVSGAANVCAVVAGFFDSVAALSHRLEAVLQDGDGVVAHGTVTYTRHDGSTLSVPFANVFRTDGERISVYLIFADVSQL